MFLFGLICCFACFCACLHVRLIRLLCYALRVLCFVWFVFLYVWCCCCFALSLCRACRCCFCDVVWFLSPFCVLFVSRVLSLLLWSGFALLFLYASSCVMLFCVFAFCFASSLPLVLMLFGCLSCWSVVSRSFFVIELFHLFDYSLCSCCFHRQCFYLFCVLVLFDWLVGCLLCLASVLPGLFLWFVCFCSRD